MLFQIGGAEGEAVELDASPFNKRGFVGPILIQREPVPPRDFLLVVLGEPHAHDELVIVQIDLVHEILENLVSNLRVVHVGMQELVEVRLDAVPVLAQRHADVFRHLGLPSAGVRFAAPLIPISGSILRSSREKAE